MQMSFLLNSALLLISHGIAFAYSNTSFTAGGSIAKQGCPSKCGDLPVPFPFGVASACSIEPSFVITCDESFDPPRAFLASAAGDVMVLGISETKIRIKNEVAKRCHEGEGMASTDFGMNFSSTPFSFSNENKLTAVGCDDVGFILRNTFNDFITSCVAICSKLEDLGDGACSGIGCCQASIPKGVQTIFSIMTSLNDRTKVPDIKSCGYTFLAEQNSYTFNVSDVSDSSFLNKTTETVPIALDWAIGNQTCNQLGATGRTICQQNSVCVDSGTTLGGYRCNCLRGYQGNPYLTPGCKGFQGDSSI